MSYGLGWMVGDNGLVMHGGNRWGFSCEIAFLPAERKTSLLAALRADPAWRDDAPLI